MNKACVLMSGGIYRLLGLALFLSIPLLAHAAFDVANLQHKEPVIDAQSASQAITVTIPSTGLKRARVLLLTTHGYKAMVMTGDGRLFTAKLTLAELAQLKYQFQVETEDGRILETKFYAVRKPSDPELEKKISDLKAESELWHAKAQQMQNGLDSLQATDPQQLAKRKDQEYARALVKLGRKEREEAEARAGAEEAAKRLKEALQSNGADAAVEAARDSSDDLRPDGTGGAADDK